LAGGYFHASHHCRQSDAYVSAPHPPDRGPIETHFHVFGSLAFSLSTGLAGVGHGDCHRRRRSLFPRRVLAESVFGVLAASPWRWIEHAFWVILKYLLDAFNFTKLEGDARRGRPARRSRDLNVSIETKNTT